VTLFLFLIFIFGLNEAHSFGTLATHRGQWAHIYGWRKAGSWRTRECAIALAIATVPLEQGTVAGAPLVLA
jgi:hypothetical protein